MKKGIITLNGKKYHVRKLGKEIAIEGKSVDEFIDYLYANDIYALVEVAKLGKYLVDKVDWTEVNMQNFINETHQKLNN